MTYPDFHKSSAASNERRVTGRITKSEKRIYRIFCEGETERQYFSYIGERFHNSAIILVKNKTREEREKNTQPSELFQLVEDAIEREDLQEISIELIAENLDSWIHDTKIITAVSKDDNLLQCLMEAFSDKGLKTSIKIDEFTRNRGRFESLLYDVLLQGLFNSIYGPSIKRNHAITFHEGMMEKFMDYIISGEGLTENVDQYCLVYDKDQIQGPEYKYILEMRNRYQLICNKKVEPYVTNPCFEFWLLMHFDDAMKNFDDVEMLKNPKKYSSIVANEKIRYSHHMIEQYIKGYRKNEIQFSKYLGPNVDTAIRNERNFCEEITALEHSLGSTVGKLIEEFMHPELAERGQMNTSKKIKFTLR